MADQNVTPSDFTDTRVCVARHDLDEALVTDALDVVIAQSAATGRVPQAITRKYLPTEKVLHQRIAQDGQRQLWRTVEDRSAAGLPDAVRWHICEGGDDWMTLMPERNALPMWDAMHARIVRGE